MLVKDVITSVLRLIGRTDVIGAMDGGLTEEQTEVVNTLLHCYNAVEDELGRLYFPLVDERELTFDGGVYVFSDMPHVPVKILAVIKDGKKLKFRLYPKYVKAVSGKLTVRYCYAPTKKPLLGMSELGEPVSERMMSYGVAAEYCLIGGLVESAEIWESKYREEIAANRAGGGYGRLPQRSWV